MLLFTVLLQNDSNINSVKEIKQSVRLNNLFNTKCTYNHVSSLAHTWLGPSQYVTYAFILWYVLTIIYLL